MAQPTTVSSKTPVISIAISHGARGRPRLTISVVAPDSGCEERNSKRTTPVSATESAPARRARASRLLAGCSRCRADRRRRARGRAGQDRGDARPGRCAGLRPGPVDCCPRRPLLATPRGSQLAFGVLVGFRDPGSVTVAVGVVARVLGRIEVPRRVAEDGRSVGLDPGSVASVPVLRELGTFDLPRIEALQGDGEPPTKFFRKSSRPGPTRSKTISPLTTGSGSSFTLFTLAQGP